MRDIDGQGRRARGAAAWGIALAVAVAAGTSACGGEAAEAADRTAGEEAAAVRLATAEFSVAGMTCGGCALAAEAALKRLPGVAGADARYDDRTGEGRATVEYDPARVAPERMMAAMEELGYEPTLLEAEGAR